MIAKGENNMKKLLKKRGFTIVEVLVAFVIFAIMAGMVSMILAQVNVARRQNTDTAEEIQQQKETYYLKDPDVSYDSSKQKGKLEFNFDNSTNIEIPYMLGDSNETDENVLALEYFVTQYTKDAKGSTGGGGDTPADDPDNPGSVTSRLDTRIYGATGVDYVVLVIKKDESYTGSGYRYFIKSRSDFSGFAQQERYAQYRILFPSVIKDYGYIDNYDTPRTIKTWRDGNAYDYEVYSPYNRTLRISNKITGDKMPLSDSLQFVNYYVVLEKPLEDIDAGLNLHKIFGYSDSVKTERPSDGGYRFQPYAEDKYDKKGTFVKTVTHYNVFGAFENASTPATTEATTEAP